MRKKYRNSDGTWKKSTPYYIKPKINYWEEESSDEEISSDEENDDKFLEEKVEEDNPLPLTPSLTEPRVKIYPIIEQEEMIVHPHNLEPEQISKIHKQVVFVDIETYSPSRERDIDLIPEISKHHTHEERNRSGSDRLKEGEVEANTLNHLNPEIKDPNDEKEVIEEIKPIEQKDEPNNDAKKMEEMNRFCVLLFLIGNKEIRKQDEKTTGQIIFEPPMNEKGDFKNDHDFYLQENLKTMKGPQA